MEKNLNYPADYAVLSTEEMTYTEGGASAAGSVVIGIAAGIGFAVLGSSYVWGIGQARDWLKVSANREGNFFTVLGRATDDIVSDMKKSPSNMVRDIVSTSMVVALAPVSAILLMVK